MKVSKTGLKSDFSNRKLVCQKGINIPIENVELRMIWLFRLRIAHAKMDWWTHIIGTHPAVMVTLRMC